MTGEFTIYTGFPHRMGNAARFPSPRRAAPWFKYSQTQEIGVNPEIAHAFRHVQRNILAGIITIGPLFVTYLIFSFLFADRSPRRACRWCSSLRRLLSIGLVPDAVGAVRFCRSCSRSIVLYIVGRVTSLVVGRKLFSLFESDARTIAIRGQGLHVRAAAVRLHDG
jgi:hypothetical protein